MNEYKNGTGKYPVTENDVGGFPVITNGIPYVDSDHDGMPDVWEIAHGLNPTNPADGPLDRGDGYSKLEGFLNGG